METSHNERETTQHKKQIRHTEIDIIAGASQTDQLEALKANAINKNREEPENAQPITVDNGSKLPDTDSQKDSGNPATRGI